MQVSPQGILHMVVDGEQLMMVPHELRQKILVENHDVLVLRAHGTQPNCGHHQTSLLVAWSMGKCRNVSAMVSGLSMYENR